MSIQIFRAMKKIQQIKKILKVFYIVSLGLHVLSGDFADMGIALKRLIFLVFLVCNNFICVIVYAPSDFLSNVLGQLLVFLSDLAVLLF